MKLYSNKQHKLFQHSSRRKQGPVLRIHQCAIETSYDPVEQVRMANKQAVIFVAPKQACA